jgi:hypothetical protein
VTGARSSAVGLKVRFGIIALLAGLVVALLGAEIAARVVDGYRLSSLRLELRPDRAQARSAAARESSLRKWRGENDAREYVERLPVAEGVDRSWFEMPLPDPPPWVPDSDLAARARRYPEAELTANYEWNAKAVSDAVCRGTLRNLISFDRFADVFEFDPIDGSDLPTFRFLPHAVYPSGLRTNGFGWRGPEISFVKPPRTIRIAFVGASTTVGPHAEPYSYPELIRFWLNRWAESRRLGVSVETINAAREGLNSRSIQAIVRQELLPIEPDLVVYYEGSNQFWPNDFLSSPEPRRSRVLGFVQRDLGSYSALVNRIEYVVRASAQSGAEPPKPAVLVKWPADLNEQDPDLRDPRLPTTLPTILADLDTIRKTLETGGAGLVMTSFAWLVYPGMIVDPARDAYLLAYLNDTFWPFSYAHMRRFIDFQNRAFRKYAQQHQLPFIDLASEYPRDPRLFDDAIHMTRAGIHLQAWIVFNGLVPEIERRIASGTSPEASRANGSVHPAFDGPRRLVSIDHIRAGCPPAQHVGS